MKPSQPVLTTLAAYGLDRARERLAANSVRREDTGCIERRAIERHYPSLKFRGVYLRAHRVAWALANNAEPGEMLVCHTCDNRQCVNPDHLFLGTPSDNARDMVAKGRKASTAIPRARKLGPKLTVEQVAAIRADPRHFADVAADYGISAVHCENIRAGRVWSKSSRAKRRAKSRLVLLQEFNPTFHAASNTFGKD